MIDQLNETDNEVQIMKDIYVLLLKLKDKKTVKRVLEYFYDRFVDNPPDEELKRL